MYQKIEELMTRNVVCARPEMSIREAAAQMRAHNIGSLPVVEEKKVVGIVTDRDLTLRGMAEGCNPNVTNVADLMTKEVVTCRPEDSLQDAEQIMHDRQLRRLPIVDGKGELVGYLTTAKVARNESNAQVGRVLKGISQPHAPAPMASYGVSGGH